MKLPLTLAGVALGLMVGGGAGSYWYLTQDADRFRRAAAQRSSRLHRHGTEVRRPLVRGNRVRSLVVADLRLEVRASGESRALALKPKVRDAFLDTLYAMAVAGAFDGDLYSNNVQDEMRARLLQAARRCYRTTRAQSSSPSCCGRTSSRAARRRDFGQRRGKRLSGRVHPRQALCMTVLAAVHRAGVNAERRPRAGKRLAGAHRDHAKLLIADALLATADLDPRPARRRRMP